MTSDALSKTPKRIWVVLTEGHGADPNVYLTRKAAKTEADDCTRLGYPSRVVGPYVLTLPKRSGDGR